MALPSNLAYKAGTCNEPVLKDTRGNLEPLEGAQIGRISLTNAVVVPATGADAARPVVVAGAFDGLQVSIGDLFYVQDGAVAAQVFIRTA